MSFYCENHYEAVTPRACLNQCKRCAIKEAAASSKKQKATTPVVEPAQSSAVFAVKLTPAEIEQERPTFEAHCKTVWAEKQFLRRADGTYALTTLQNAFAWWVARAEQAKVEQQALRRAVARVHDQCISAMNEDGTSHLYGAVLDIRAIAQKALEADNA